MTKLDFTDALQKYYKPENDLIIQRLHDWLLDRHIKDDELELFFGVITENHENKYFPNIPQLTKYYQSYRGGKILHDDGGIVANCLRAKTDQRQKVQRAHILQVVEWLKIANSWDQSENPMAINLLHEWKDILMEYWETERLKMDKQNAKEHLEDVRTCIAEGRPFHRLGIIRDERKKIQDLTLDFMSTPKSNPKYFSE